MNAFTRDAEQADRATSLLFEAALGNGPSFDTDEAASRYVQELLNQGANPNAVRQVTIEVENATETETKDENRSGTPLMVALMAIVESWCSKLWKKPKVCRVMRALIPVSDLHVERPSDGRTALMLAFSFGNAEAVESIITLVGRDKLMQSDHDGHTLLDILEQNDRELGDDWIKWYRSVRDSDTMERWIVALGRTVTPTPSQRTFLTELAIQKDWPFLLHEMIADSVDAKGRVLDPDPYWAIECAVENGSIKALDLLLKSGMNPNACSAEGTTPLMIAAWALQGGTLPPFRKGRKSFSCWQRLLPVSDVNAVDEKGETALMKIIEIVDDTLASDPQTRGLLQELVLLTDVHLKNHIGDTALLKAAYLNNTKAVTLLAPLSDLSLVGHQGTTAFESALAHKNWDAANALMGAMSPEQALAATVSTVKQLMPQGAVVLEAALLAPYAQPCLIPAIGEASSEPATSVTTDDRSKKRL